MDSPTPNLTEDEKVLHRHAVTLKKMLEDYHACACESRDEGAWGDRFKDLMVYLYSYEHSHR